MGIKDDLLGTADFQWIRLRDRVEGLTDEEYLWEPVAGCWSIRPGADGVWWWETVPDAPEPTPFTTIAWRLFHLIDLYGEDRTPNWLGIEPQGPAIGLDGDGAPPPTASGAIEMLEAAHDRWRGHLESTTDERLAESIGPIGGRYGDARRVGFVLHVLDEFAHHGAEVGLLRDLWHWQRIVGR